MMLTSVATSVTSPLAALVVLGFEGDTPQRAAKPRRQRTVRPVRRRRSRSLRVLRPSVA
jgi:hypothetical protein